MPVVGYRHDQDCHQNRMGLYYVGIRLVFQENIGYHIGIQTKNQDWLTALDMALQANFPEGVREYHLNLMSDNGSQPTSRKFMKECENLKINHVITSYNNPKDNADTKRVMRTMKEECLWLEEWESFSDVETKLTSWINKYN